jgi:hypothetical protein
VRIILEPSYTAISKELSPAQEAINPFLESVGELVSTITPLGPVWAKLNPNPVKRNSRATISADHDVFLNAQMTVMQQQALSHKLTGARATRMDVLEEYVEQVGIDRNDAHLEFYLRCGSVPSLDYSDSVAIHESTQRLLENYMDFVKYNIQLKNIKASYARYSLVLDVLNGMTNRSLPPDSLEVKKSEEIVYRTEMPELDLTNPPKEIKYTIIEVRPKPSSSTDSLRKTVAKGDFRIGKKHLFQISAGVGATLSDFTYRSFETVNGQLKAETNGDKVRMIAGVHVYPLKLFLQDKSFMGIKNKTMGQKNPRVLNRLSVFLGVGIPDPLKNYYLGASSDLLPGFRLIAGAHFYRNNRYNIQNDQIVEESAALRLAGPFLSFNIEPTSFVKALNLF